LDALPDRSLAGLVLAAGGSSRLGQPKQLYEWRGTPLVCRAVEACLEVCGAGVVVVTGAHAHEVEARLESYPVQIVRNSGWKTGMAGSLQAGIQKLRGSSFSGVLISLCDQPRLDSGDLASLANVWQTSPELPAAARYKGIIGVPAIFPGDYLDSLLNLQGDQGARSLLSACASVSSVEMPAAAFDIDTVADLARLESARADSE